MIAAAMNLAPTVVVTTPVKSAATAMESATTAMESAAVKTTSAAGQRVERQRHERCASEDGKKECLRVHKVLLGIDSLVR
jgi:hypothetical protein